MDTARLEALGLTKAAGIVKDLRKRSKQLTLAYEHFRYVRKEKIAAFNEKLKKRSLKIDGEAGVDRYDTYDRLAFTPLQEYAKAPPEKVLEDLEKAQVVGCFDSSEVATIASVREYKDPIIFGRIAKCPDRFFISQWDDDVKIEDILAEHEG